MPAKVRKLPLKTTRPLAALLPRGVGCSTAGWGEETGCEDALRMRLPRGDILLLGLILGSPAAGVVATRSAAIGGGGSASLEARPLSLGAIGSSGGSCGVGTKGPRKLSSFVLSLLPGCMCSGTMAGQVRWDYGRAERVRYRYCKFTDLPDVQIPSRALELVFVHLVDVLARALHL